MKIQGSGKPLKGSKSPGIGYFYIVLIMFLAIAIATSLSGGFIPVDPNSAGGPPTLPAYFGTNGINSQKIILPTDLLTPNPKDNLQLKTFTVDVCGETTAIDILIDTSGSMADDNKINKLKDALKTFTVHFKDSTAVAIQTFSAKAEEKVSWGLYKDNKQQVQATINGLNADGWTTMKDGFSLAEKKILDAKNNNRFPGYSYYLLLISDGVPEIPPDQPRTCYFETDDPRTAPAKRCFAKEQDPRVPVDIPSNIKQNGVPVYVIGLYSNISSDVRLQAYLVPLLQQISSQPLSNFYHEYNSSSNSEDLKKIFNNIINSVCDKPLGT
jgi:hypothetical protein